MEAEEFYNILKENGTDCFCGVPDSLLKSFCAFVSDNSLNHTITANEGNAIALAAGYNLATGNIAAVYMQNSGLGNCVNPLLSLTNEEVYNIPVLLIIGWRGEPDKKDEPQHIKQGKVTDKLLETMGIKYKILPETIEEAKPLINRAYKYMKETNKPFAFIVKKGTFEEYKLQNKIISDYNFSREEAIETVLKHLDMSDIVISTTGHISREVYETRERLNQSHKQDFLTVGSMGHSSSIALGIALEKKDRNIYCFDGDGAFLMHEGAISVIASKNLKNFKHIIFNNEAHDSVGSQPTAAKNINIAKIALDSGYKKSYSVSSKEDLEKIIPEFISNNCTSLLEIKVKCGARDDLGRPKEKPVENKEAFIQNLKQVTICKKGAINELSNILKIEKVKKALIFTGKKSYEAIKHIIEPELKNVKCCFYNNFSTNPKKEEIDFAISKIDGNFDIIIAIGGGSVIDFAKAYRYYQKLNKKLIAIPTTFGTGSEATQFSVIYIEGSKVSLGDCSILPEYAIVDSVFAKFQSKYLKATTVLDAYCQAIESYWAKKADKISKNLALEAIKIIKENIVQYVNNDDETVNYNISYASNLAGCAINISRTTASHALSYKITTNYNIPHGHAVALTIAQLFKINTSNKNSVLKEVITDSPIEYFKDLFTQIGIEYDFKKLGITDIDDIANNVNPDRLLNNPVKLNKETILKILENRV